MRLPYWVYKLRDHSDDWSGWRVKYVEGTLRARVWDCKETSCHTCPERYYVSRGNTPIYRWRER